jgi:uncharacterized metal-binding protein
VLHGRLTTLCGDATAKTKRDRRFAGATPESERIACGETSAIRGKSYILAMACAPDISRGCAASCPSCEGPCIRGEIARRAANLVAADVPTFARACHAETFFVPHSSMARWVKDAEQCVMIDGCFLKCHGRVLKELVGEERVIHIDALMLYKKYTDIFSMDDVPEEERKAVARQVADQIVAKLKEENHQEPATAALQAI